MATNIPNFYNMKEAKQFFKYLWRYSSWKCWPPVVRPKIKYCWVICPYPLACPWFNTHFFKMLETSFDLKYVLHKSAENRKIFPLNPALFIRPQSWFSCNRCQFNVFWMRTTLPLWGLWAPIRSTSKTESTSPKPSTNSYNFNSSPWPSLSGRHQRASFLGASTTFVRSFWQTSQTWVSGAFQTVRPVWSVLSGIR